MNSLALTVLFAACLVMPNCVELQPGCTVTAAKPGRYLMKEGVTEYRGDFGENHGLLTLQFYALDQGRWVERNGSALPLERYEIIQDEIVHGHLLLECPNVPVG